MRVICQPGMPPVTTAGTGQPETWRRGLRIPARVRDGMIAAATAGTAVIRRSRAPTLSR